MCICESTRAVYTNYENEEPFVQRTEDVAEVGFTRSITQTAI